MTIIGTPILDVLYQEARDAEHNASSFWQVVLQRAFFEKNIYSVTGEPIPDGSYRVVVKRYYAKSDTLKTLLSVECKKHMSSARDAEDEARDTCMRLRSMDGGRPRHFWAMTTLGLAFRFWSLRDGCDTLQPEYVPARADRSEYTDANSAEAVVFYDAVRTIKAYGDWLV